MYFLLYLEEYYSDFLKSKTMAKGKNCPQCGHYMRGDVVEECPAGDYIVYTCLSSRCGFKVKVFEDK